MAEHSAKAKSLQRINKLIKRLASIRDARAKDAPPSDLQLELGRDLDREWRVYRQAVTEEIAGTDPLF